MPAVTAPPVQFFVPPTDRRHDRGDTGPLSHAVRISFAAARQAEQAAQRFEAAVRSCWPAGAAEDARGPRLWVEDVAGPATGPIAARRRSVELSRVIGPDHQPALRGVLLRYQDGPADLIVVCYRAFMPEPGLRRLAALLLGSGRCDGAPGELPAHSTTVPGQEGQKASWRPTSVVPDWGLGDRHAGDLFAACRFPLGDPALGDVGPHGDLTTWLTALAAVLACYGDDEPPLLATLVPTPAGPQGGPALVESPMLLLTAAQSNTPLGDLANHIRNELRRPGGPAPRPAPRGLAHPAVGLLFSVRGEDHQGRVQASVEYHPCQVPIFPLTISVVPDADGTVLWCYYRLRCFAPSVVRQFARHLAEAHRQVIQSPHRGLAEVDLLDADERGQVAALGRPPRSLRTQAACIHDLIAEHARTHPDAAALSDGKQRMCYAELDARSDQMARGLRTLDVRDGDRVGICLERSADLVVALLGVLKAGAVYVPMDPAYPVGRLSYTVHDGALRVVIGTPGEFPAGGGVHVITPGDLADLGDGGPPGPPASEVTGTDPAYVIYTSGSTGRPKGVVVPHANVVALIDATRAEYQLEQSDIWTMFHSSAFDFSVWEIWGSLLTGGQLIVVPHWVSRSPEEFQILLAEEKVTVLSQTPSAFGQLLRADQQEPRELAVRLIIFGGEPLDARMLLPWFDRHPESSCRVVNMFGITETTVHVTAQTITRQHGLERSRSVGQALPGWHVYILDARQRMVPPGVAGEIYVGGAGVSLGYLNQPELTSQRFVPDPFSGLPMYRSGDKGRLRPDGSLEHLGRLDSQVKVRGFRIELDEIRNVLLELPGVVAAAVVVNRADASDAASARIDAYIVLAADSGSADDVRHQAARILPDYMVPAEVIPLDALPLTTNGKLDVTRLPAAEVTPAGAGVPAPAGDFPADLLASWTHVLGRQVELDDDFFKLGGNSLHAVRVGAAMRDRGWPSVPIREIYRNTTIRRLATAMGHAVL
jgi:amino acid adenylation domain-containing protein